MDARSGIVRLNVGGKVFATTAQTLCKEPDSFLARLCEIDGLQPSVKDASGAFFIDRDPRYFRIILNYLRSNVVDLEGNVSLEAVISESDVYGINGLTKRLEEQQRKMTAQPHVRTVSVRPTFGGADRTYFTSSHDDVLLRIKSCEKMLTLAYLQRRCEIRGDTLSVDKAFTLAELCDILGYCDLVLRHVQKDSKGHDACFHFSSP